MRRAELRDLYLAVVLGITQASAASPSLAAKRALVSLLAAVAGAAPTGKRDRISRGIRRALPDLSKPRRLRIERQSLRTTWTEILSWAPCPAERDEWRRASVTGAQHLDEALRHGQGVILWESAGFGHRWPVKQWLRDHGRAPAQVHGPNALGCLDVPDLGSSRFRNETLRPAFEALERRTVAEILTLNASGPSVGVLRAVGRRLRQNGIVSITGDGGEGSRRIKVRMLGRDQLFATGIPNLVRSCGSRLVPVFCWRSSEGRLQIAMEEPLATGGPDRDEAIRGVIEIYAKRLEARILESPGQYRNWHLLGDATT